MTILVVEIFQPGPKWWSHWHCHPYPTTATVAKNTRVTSFFICEHHFLSLSVLCLTSASDTHQRGPLRVVTQLSSSASHCWLNPWNSAPLSHSPVLCFSFSFPLSSLFTHSSPASSVLSARFAELWWRHTTGRGQRRGQSISLTLLFFTSRYAAPLSLSSWVIPGHSNCAPYASPPTISTFHLQYSNLWPPAPFPASYQQSARVRVYVFFSFTGAALAPNLSSGLM